MLMNVRVSARALAISLLLAGIASVAGAAEVTLDFEGLKDLEPVREFYNGGVGGSGSGPGLNAGVSFSENALALVDFDAGGSGDFGGEPSPSTALFFRSGAAATLNAASGFGDGLSLYYSAIIHAGTVRVYDGLNGTGAVLATLELPVTPDSGAPDPGGRASPFVPVSVAFNGTARSVGFGGTADEIVFDNITLGAAPAAVPEPGTMALLGLGALALVRRRRPGA